MRGKVAKNVLLVLVLFIFILTILPQNAVAEETRQVKNAPEILDKIEKGELVAEENCTIIGDLDLSKIKSNLSSVTVNRRKLYIVNNSFSIKNSLIKGDVNFNDGYFSKPVGFDGTTFIGMTNFEKTVFNGSADFEKANFSFDANFMITTFNKLADFENVNFTGRAQFDYATFNWLAWFSKAHFYDEANFDKVKFYDEVEFNNIVFKSVAAFRWSEFYNETQFNNATFNEDAQFDKAKFKGKVEFKDYTRFNETASFPDATFAKLANFENAQFSKKADFTDTEFNDKAKFTGVTFNGYANFTDVTFNKAYFEFAKFNKTIDFSNTDFNDEAHFSNATFNDTIKFNLAKFKDRSFFLNTSFKDEADFTGTYIQLMNIEWKQLEGKLVYDDYFYQSLIRNFETLGLFGDADDAYYEYRKIKQSQKEWKDYTKYIDAFSKCICGYGVKPVKAIICAGIIIGLFSALYWWIEVEDRLKKLRGSLKEKWNRLWEFVDRLIRGKENKKSRSDSPLKDSLKRLWEFFKDRGKRALKFLFLSVSIFTTLGILNNWKSAEDHETWFHFFAIAEVFLGWIIMSLFVISLTMTWIR
jgi:hypothetical protein